ncbi:MAG: hypothetical protein ACK5PQ_05125 [Alphaproteobacteria bacterium]
MNLIRTTALSLVLALGLHTAYAAGADAESPENKAHARVLSTMQDEIKSHVTDIVKGNGTPISKLEALKLFLSANELPFPASTLTQQNALPLIRNSNIDKLMGLFEEGGLLESIITSTEDFKSRKTAALEEEKARAELVTLRGLKETLQGESAAQQERITGLEAELATTQKALRTQQDAKAQEPKAAGDDGAADLEARQNRVLKHMKKEVRQTVKEIMDARKPLATIYHLLRTRLPAQGLPKVHDEIFYNNVKRFVPLIADSNLNHFMDLMETLGLNDHITSSSAFAERVANDEPLDMEEMLAKLEADSKTHADKLMARNGARIRAEKEAEYLREQLATATQKLAEAEETLKNSTQRCKADMVRVNAENAELVTLRTLKETLQGESAAQQERITALEAELATAQEALRIQQDAKAQENDSALYWRALYQQALTRIQDLEGASPSETESTTSSQGSWTFITDPTFQDTIQEAQEKIASLQQMVKKTQADLQGKLKEVEEERDEQADEAQKLSQANEILKKAIIKVLERP